MQRLMARMVLPSKSLEEWASDINEWAVSKGWRENPRTVSDYVALVVTELAEAMEEYRKGLKFNDVYYSVQYNVNNNYGEGLTGLAASGLAKVKRFQENRGDSEGPTEAEWEALVYAGVAKPEGIAVEFIDAVIRMLENFGAEGTDVERLMVLKMAYNKTRSHRHGGKVL